MFTAWAMAIVQALDAFLPTGRVLPWLLAGLVAAAMVLSQKRSGLRSDGRVAASARSKKRAGRGTSEDEEVLPHADSASSVGSADEEVQSQPHLQGTLIPFCGQVHSNAAESFSFENHNCCGKFLPLHRPTHDPALDASGEYPYGDHFRGRRRLWEMRIQFRVKQPVKGKLVIGLELENYVPLTAAAKRLMGLTVAAMRRVVGDDLYHSVGDDPREGSAPHEKPVFMMPLWACDQLIVTKAGEEPPDLTSSAFSTFGMKRVDDRKAFVAEMAALSIVPENVYTVCFWGISQFLDCIKWEVQKVVPFRSLDFNQFCGRPPVAVVMYTLNPSDDGDTRHTQPRKNYYFRFALWSSLRPPSAAKLRELIPNEGALGRLQTKTTTSESWLARTSRRLGLGCCAQPR